MSGCQAADAHGGTVWPGPSSCAPRLPILIGMETLGSHQVYANPWIAVREDAVRRSDGSTSVYWVVDTSDIALVIPTEGDLLHLVEQYRYRSAVDAGSSPPEARTRGLTLTLPRSPHANCARRQGSLPAVWFRSGRWTSHPAR